MTSTATTLSPALKRTRQLIWAYFWLLILEGALRKWIVPSLSNVLLIVRDPVVIAIYAMAAQAGVFPKNTFVVMTTAIGVACFMVSFIVIPEHPVVSIYGLRANYLHIPLVFVIQNVFTIKDVRKVGFWILLTAIPMAFIVYLQFTSPGDARINAGAGEGSGQIESAGGKIRPAGTFSYSTGMVSYAALLASYVFYSFFKEKAYPFLITIASAGSLFVMVACSGSRSCLSAVGLLVVAAGCITLYRPKFLAGSAKALVIIVLVYAVVGSWAVVKEGQGVLDDRVSGNGGVKEGLVDRYITTLLPINEVFTAPVFGFGLGMGTNAAAGLLTGTRGFMLAENDWQRVILESGPLLGLAYIILRAAMVGHAGASMVKPLNQGDALAALLFAADAIPFLNGQFAQPSALGFAVFNLGLCLAAANPEAPSDNQAPPPVVAAPLRSAPVRSRSALADKLHSE